MTESVDLSGAKRRIVDRLKRADSVTAPELAAEFGLTDTAIRQHLESLEASGLVERVEMPRQGRGRPPVHWRLAAASDGLFTDRHSELTVELLATIRTELGDEALDTVVAARARRQLAHYETELLGAGGVDEKVRRLADLRSAEGYLAEAVSVDGRLMLVEHHCPIKGAAESCGSLCAAELDLFRTALGPEVAVEREQHLLDGGQRCAYVVTAE